MPCTIHQSLQIDSTYEYCTQKKTSYVHASQLSIQTTECLAISLVMQQNAETWLGLFVSHLWLKCSLALAGACIKHQREIHFPPCCGVFTVITGGFDPPMEKEINNVYYIISVYLSIYTYTSSSLTSLACYLLPNCTHFSVCSDGRCYFTSNSLVTAVQTVQF